MHWTRFCLNARGIFSSFVTGQLHNKPPASVATSMLRYFNKIFVPQTKPIAVLLFTFLYRNVIWFMLPSFQKWNLQITNPHDSSPSYVLWAAAPSLGLVVVIDGPTTQDRLTLVGPPDGPDSFRRRCDVTADDLIGVCALLHDLTSHYGLH